MYLAKASYKTYPNSNKIDRYLVGFIIFYSVISAIRWRVGSDSVPYALEFMTGVTGHEFLGMEENELVMKWLVHFIFGAGLHFSIGMGILSFFQILPMTKLLANYKYILVFMPIALFGSRYYLTEMGGMRQMVVASFFVYFSRYILERKIWKYLFSVFISIFIHQSAILLLPLYFIPLTSIIRANQRWLLLLIFFSCFIIGLSPSFHLLVQYGEVLASMIGYSDYGMRVADFAAGDTEEALSFGPMMLSYFLISLSLILSGPMLKRKFEAKIPYFNLWYSFSFLWGCLYFLVCNVSHIFIRPMTYFILFEMIMLSLLLFDLFNRGKKQIQVKMFAISMVGIIWVNISWNIIKAESQKNHEYVIYKMFFMYKDEVNAALKER